MWVRSRVAFTVGAIAFAVASLLGCRNSDPRPFTANLIGLKDCHGNLKSPDTLVTSLAVLPPQLAHSQRQLKTSTGIQTLVDASRTVGDPIQACVG